MSSSTGGTVVIKWAANALYIHSDKLQVMVSFDRIICPFLSAIIFTDLLKNTFNGNTIISKVYFFINSGYNNV